MRIIFPETPSRPIDIGVRNSFEQRMKMLVWMFIIDTIVGIGILIIFSARLVPNYTCDLTRTTWWISLWPPNHGYIETILHANFSASDICVLVSTLSASMIVCVTTIIPVTFIIMFCSPTIYFKHGMSVLAFGLIAGVIAIDSGIDTQHILFGPNIYEPIVFISIYIVVVMAGWFFLLAFLFFDRVRSSAAHFTVSR